MREIPDSVNITETSTSTKEGLEDVVFDERYNDYKKEGLPQNTAASRELSESSVSSESEEDDDVSEQMNE